MSRRRINNLLEDDYFFPPKRLQFDFDPEEHDFKIPHDDIVLRLIWPSKTSGHFECVCEIFGERSTFSFFENEMAKLYNIEGQWVRERDYRIFYPEDAKSTFKSLDIKHGDTLSILNDKSRLFIETNLKSLV